MIEIKIKALRETCVEGVSRGLPESCCINKSTCKVARQADYFSVGCVKVVKGKLDESMDILYYSGIAVLAVHVFSLFLACCAVNSVRKENEHTLTCLNMSLSFEHV